MPLLPGRSKEIISKNIKELMSTGKYDVRQATAIAYSNARRTSKRRRKRKKTGD